MAATIVGGKPCARATGGARPVEAWPRPQSFCWVISGNEDRGLNFDGFDGRSAKRCELP